jgi:hypothetical protein
MIRTQQIQTTQTYQKKKKSHVYLSISTYTQSDQFL